jgi:hypothetical protein
MNRFMIGQYGTFDDNKYKRDFREGFFGIEACLFNSQEDTQNLVNESRKKGFIIGIHFPFRSGLSKIRDALFLSQDENIRGSAYELIQSELDYLTTIKPNYILFHYPKPVILDDRVNWSKWRFADKLEYVYESEITLEELAEKTESLFRWLTSKSEDYNFVPVLEFDALNRYIYETNFLEGLLSKYPKIKLCLDTGRLFVQEKLDPFFDAKKVIKKFARFAYTVHLWSVQVQETVENNHYPVLPELDPNKGWAPIEDYLKIIFEENHNVKIIFEHRSELISDEQLNQCYLWVESIVKNANI